MTPAPKEPMSE
ncbi:hypothetical protein RDI58_029129 [Solanum bulbocastanum]|uniref:Uncharacterized protein n=1 Tax=Solanum bulbocastanum TaxID=147425 RepID=A0AAN8XZB2_SOLBU